MSRSAPRPIRPSLHGEREPTGSPPVVRAVSPRDIVASVPYQCGFQPERSLVVISLRGARRRFGLVCRMDLPDDGDRAAAAREVASFVARDEAAAALVLVYDEAPWDAASRPHHPLVAELVATLERGGVPTLDAFYVTTERYWSYECRDARCCPAEGSLVEEAGSSPVAAASVMAGLAPLASRDALGTRLTPSAPLLVAAVKESTARWLQTQAADLETALLARRGDPAETVRREHLRRWTGATFRLMAALVTAYRDDHAEMDGQRDVGLDVEQAGQLLASLQSRDIRDAVLMGFCCYGLGPVPDLSPLLDIGYLPDLAAVDNQSRRERTATGPDASAVATELAVERLLLDLCCRVDGPAAGPPLTLVAWHSWARGYGALARVAVERALEHDPSYRLARLLVSALDRGLAPDWVAGARAADAS